MPGGSPFAAIFGIANCVPLVHLAAAPSAIETGFAERPKSSASSPLAFRSA